MKTNLILTGLFAVMAVPAAAFAHEGLGVGIVSGDTNGITLKIPTVGITELDLSAGTDITGDDARLRADWQRPFILIDNANIVVPFYLGLGGFVQGNAFGEIPNFGLRVPVGMSLQLQSTPLEVYAQTGLEAVLIDQQDINPSLGLTGAVGLRLYGFSNLAKKL